MKKIAIFLVAIVGIVAMIIIPNIFSREAIEFNQDCVSFDIGSDIFDIVNVQINGEIRKKIFDDRGEVDLELQVGDIKYPINTKKMKAIENRKPVTFDPYNIDCVPTINYIQTYCLYYEDYIVIPISYSYWNDRYKKNYRKDHGTLYISNNGKDIVFTPWKDTGNSWSWSFNQGFPIVVSGEDILRSLDIIDEHFGWTVHSWKQYYEQTTRNLTSYNIASGARVH